MKKALLAVAALLLVASCAPHQPWGGPGWYGSGPGWNCSDGYWGGYGYSAPSHYGSYGGYG